MGGSNNRTERTKKNKNDSLPLCVLPVLSGISITDISDVWTCSPYFELAEAFDHVLVLGGRGGPRIYGIQKEECASNPTSTAEPRAQDYYAAARKERVLVNGRKLRQRI